MANGLFTLKQVNQALRQSAWTGQKTPSVQYLVVAGGGGGGRGGGGGGGAGGLLQGVVPVPSGQSLTVTVGTGGAQGASYGAAGTNGTNSVFNNITATGGGGGAGYYTVGGGKSGGSGGGGADDYYVSTYPTASVQGQGISSQGNAGGAFSNAGPCASGGGGAATAGFSGASLSGSATGGFGGLGVASNISGTTTTYSGGGAGGGGLSSVTPLGGVGGGGNGGYGGAGVPTAGSANTGGGGGGDWNDISVAGSGGSGIVILSYPDTYAAAASTSNATVTTSGAGSFFTNSNSFTYTPSSSTYNLGANNFTLEMWINVSTQNNLIRAIEQFGVGLLMSGGQLLYYVSSNGSSWDVANGVSGGSISLNTWTHIALVRNGTVFTPYVNGVAGTTTISAATVSSITGFCLMSERPLTNPGGSGVSTGYASNFRAVIGTSVYTSNFTPPTTPLTAITNTKVLLNNVSGAYLADSSFLSAAMLVGTNTPTWNSASPFATGLGYKNRVYTWTTSGSITF